MMTFCLYTLLLENIFHIRGLSYCLSRGFETSKQIDNDRVVTCKKEFVNILFFSKLKNGVTLDKEFTLLLAFFDNTI